MSQQLPHRPPGSSPWQPGWPTQPLEPPHKPPIYTRAWVIVAAVLGMLGLGVIACTALILAIGASAHRRRPTPRRSRRPTHQQRGHDNHSPARHVADTGDCPTGPARHTTDHGHGSSCPIDKARRPTAAGPDDAQNLRQRR
jgi:hypothetical protein